jgi:hypothetical protein
MLHELAPFASFPAEFRRTLYFGACIPVRLVVVWYAWAHEASTAAVAKLAALVFLAVRGVHNGRPGRWWSHGLLVGVALLVLAAPPPLVKYVLLASIAAGLAQAPPRGAW